ncbi:hypothetical protein KFE25_011208 [Diacronema lutheri]|uniref:Chloride channel protein n=1 Tax=Diacronema lutheri TaxID=2081491 RepID=A0A8J5X7Y2_DIALT|nr:hypothetical protein KFE25_011208 [Diacronema lutheri]
MVSVLNAHARPPDDLPAGDGAELRARASPGGAACVCCPLRTHARADADGTACAGVAIGFAGARARSDGVDAEGGARGARAVAQHVAIESIDYEAPITFAAKAILRDQRELRLAARERSLLPLVYIAVGVLAALCTSAVHACSLELLDAKFRLISLALGARDGVGGVAVFVVSSALLAGAAAAVLLLIAPAAAGSGMSAVLLLFNGSHMTTAFTSKVLLAKAVGLVLVAGAGLACGPEGPMIHLGAIVGTLTFKVATAAILWRSAELHGRGRAWIDLAGCGAGAAIASAFLAPVGGVLFVLEELGLWNKTLLVRLVLTCLVASTVARVALALEHDGTLLIFERVTYEALLERDPSLDAARTPRGVFAFEFIAFGALGLLGGAAGVCWNALAVAVHHLRGRWLTARWHKLCDATLVGGATAACFWSLALSWPCERFDADNAPEIVRKYARDIGCAASVAAVGNAGRNADGDTGVARRALAGAGGDEAGSPPFFNPLGTLLFAPPLATAEMLFTAGHSLFSGAACAAYGAAFGACALALLGCVVPHGLLVTTISVGGALGRALGTAASDAGGEQLNERVFALVGATAFVAGTSHTTMAFTLILVELVNDSTYLVPCVVAALVARTVSVRFGGSNFYEALLETAGHSILTQSDDERPEFNLLTADDVMCRTPVCVHVSERLLTLARLVSASPHPGFPIVDSRTGDDALPGRSASSASVAPAIVPASSEAGVRRVHGAAGTELGARRAPPSCFQSPSAREPQPEAGYFTGFVTRERIVDILRLAFEHESGSSTTDRTTSGGGRGTLSGSARRVGGARRRRRGSGIVLPPLFPPLPPPSPPLRPPSSPREQRLGAAGVVGARMSASASCLAAAAAASAPSAADGVETEARALAGVELENAVGALATKLDGRPGAAQGAEARSTPQRAGRRTAALSDASGARGLLARSSHTAAETVLSAASAPTPLVRRHVRVSAAFASGGGASRDGAASAGGDPPVVRDAARPAEERELARALASLDIAADPRKVAARCGMWVPLRPESDIVPHVLGKDAPVRVLLQTFISLGARHVTVVDSSRRVVGIVTRADVLPDVLARLYDDLTPERTHYRVFGLSARLAAFAAQLGRRRRASRACSAATAEHRDARTRGSALAGGRGIGDGAGYAAQDGAHDSAQSRGPVGCQPPPMLAADANAPMAVRRSHSWLGRGNVGNAKGNR